MKGTPLLPLRTKDLPGLKSNNQQDTDASISAFNGGQKSLEQLLKTFLPHPLHDQYVGVASYALL